MIHSHSVIIIHNVKVYRIYMLKKRYSLFYFIMPLTIGFLQVASFDSVYGWLNVFLYSLFFLFVHKTLSKAFLQGYVYGMVYFTLHSWGFTTFVDVNNFPIYYKLLPILYYLVQSVYSACWFMFLSVAQKYTTGLLRYVLFVHITWGYVLWIHYKSFYMFLLDMGYPLLFPFTPSINNSVLTFLFYTTGIMGGTYIILMYNGLLAYVFENKGYKYYISTIGISIIGLIGLSPVTDYEPSPYNPTKTIFYMNPPCYNENIQEMVQAICNQLNRKMAQESSEEHILAVFPETTLPFYFSERTLKILPQHILHEPRVQIMLGLWSEKEEKVYNSSVLLQNGRIILHYDKKKLLPFWEFIPAHNTLLLNSLFGAFLDGVTPFSTGSSDTCQFFSYDNELYITMLCSELFWFDHTEYSSNINIMCLLNDSHFQGSLLQKIMLLYGRFVAGTQHRKVFYMAHFEGLLLGENGKIIKKF